MGRRVSIVLVTWNSAPYLPRCLAGIAQQSWPDIELIVVDNGSTDETIRLLHADRIIRNEDNRGFAAAVNQGLAVATGELVLLCNPDAFLQRDYIARIVAALDEAGEAFGMATGKLLRGAGTNIEPTELVDTKGIRMTRSGRHFDIEQGEVDRDDAVGEVFGVSGAAAMYRVSFLRDVAIDDEVFDEDFFTYREDADIAWRGRLFGWRALYVPEAVGYHVRTVTPAKRRQLSPIVNMHGVKNRFLLRLKNEGLYLALRNAPFELPRDLVAIIATLTIERTSLPALTWIWRNRRRVLAKRRAIQSRRRVSDRELARWFR
jgi:GT2 family glycosyltransferase